MELKTKLNRVIRDREDISIMSNDEIIEFLRLASRLPNQTAEQPKILTAIDSLSSERYGDDYADALHIAFAKSWFSWCQMVLKYLEQT